MNSSSNLPPTGLLLRLRVIGQEQKGQALSSMIRSSPTSQGAKSGSLRVISWGVLSSQMERTERPKQRSCLGGAFRKSQCPSVEQALFQREDSYPGASKKPQILPWIPISHLVDSSAPRPLQPQLFPIAKSWELLDSVGWGLPNKKGSECSIQPQRNVSKPTSEQPCFYPHLPYPPFPFSHT